MINVRLSGLIEVRSVDWDVIYCRLVWFVWLYVYVGGGAMVAALVEDISA